MTRPFPPEFCAGAFAHVSEGRQVNHTTDDPGIIEIALLLWIRQDDINSGRRLG